MQWLVSSYVKILNMGEENLKRVSREHKRSKATTLNVKLDVQPHSANDEELKVPRNDSVTADKLSSTICFEIRPFKTKLAPGMTLRGLEELMREI